MKNQSIYSIKITTNYGKNTIKHYSLFRTKCSSGAMRINLIYLNKFIRIAPGKYLVRNRL